MNFLQRIKRTHEDLNWGRDIVKTFALNYIKERNDNEPITLLDVGMGSGKDVDNIIEICKKQLPCCSFNVWGVESYPPYVEALTQKGYRIASVDIEKESIPMPDQSVDIIVCNQVLEHTKEVFWIVHEYARILKPGGIVIVGVPNLASLHSRIMLLLGMQPSSIETVGPHVRAFTKGAMKRFVTYGNYFSLEKVKGSNFYPFPPFLSKMLSLLFPTQSVTLFFVFQRTEKKGRFIEVLENNFFETPFFKGI